MNLGFKAAIILGLAAAAWPLTVPAADPTAPAPATPATPDFTNQTEKISYGLGMYIGTQIIKRNGMEVDADVMMQAVRDVLAGRSTKLTEQQAQETINAYAQELRAKRDQQRLKLAEKNRQDGDAFLVANKQKDGVKTHAVKLAENSTAELQYKTLAEGTGDAPKASDMVVLNLKGTLINGKEFANYAGRKTPVNRLQQGVSEAVQLMKPGAKWQLFLPAALAFGDFGSGQIVEPGSAVIYEVELVSVETPQPLTSDIIEVPSKEMLDKGAQIKVHKPEELKRMMMTNAPAPAKK